MNGMTMHNLSNGWVDYQNRNCPNTVDFNSAIGGVKKDTEITGHNCGFESLKTLTPDLAYHSAGGVKAEYRCSYLSIESQICNSTGNKKGNTANATFFYVYFCKNKIPLNSNLLVTNLCYYVQELAVLSLGEFLRSSLHVKAPIHPNYFPSSYHSKIHRHINADSARYINDGRAFPRCHIFHMVYRYLHFFRLSSDNSHFQVGEEIPLDCSSFRIIRFIQAAKDSSPSCVWANSIISLNSGSNLNWNGGLPRLSFLCVDTSITPIVMCLCVMTHYIQLSEKAMPCSASTLTGHLTTNDNLGIEAAMKDHITPVTGRNSHTLNIIFTWRFAECQENKATYHTTTAHTENEARSQLPDLRLVFTAKIRREVNYV